MAKFIFSVCEFKETEDLVAMTMPEKLSIFFFNGKQKKIAMEQILYKTSLHKILRRTPRKVRARKKKTEDDKCFFSESARTCATILRIHVQTLLFSEKVDFN